jgi:hypothetical protein
MQKVVTLAELVPSELAAFDRDALRRLARYAVGFGVLDTSASAHFDDPASAGYFSERYRDLRKDVSPAGPSYAVRDEAGRVHFWSGDGPAYVWPHGALSPAATAFVADAFATHGLFSSLPSAIALHAAALRRNDVAFGLTGLSTAGKSTTALACVSAGAQLYSDERCVTTPLGTIPYPRTLNVRRGGIDLLVQTLPPSDLRDRLAAHRGSDWNSVRRVSPAGAGPVARALRHRGPRRRPAQPRHRAGCDAAALRAGCEGLGARDRPRVRAAGAVRGHRLLRARTRYADGDCATRSCARRRADEVRRRRGHAGAHFG